MKAKMREKVEETILKCGAFIIFSISKNLWWHSVFFHAGMTVLLSLAFDFRSDQRWERLTLTIRNFMMLFSSEYFFSSLTCCYSLLGNSQYRGFHYTWSSFDSAPYTSLQVQTSIDKKA